MNSTGLYSTKMPQQSFEKSCYFLEINLDVPFYVFFMNITTSVINGVSSVVAVTANGLVLVVMWKNPALHTASNVLLSCLAFSDLIVGLVSQPATIVYKVSENRGDFQLLCIAKLVTELTGWTASGVSFLTLTAIGVERYISLFRPLRYHTLITTKKTLSIVLCFWIVLIVQQAVRFWFLDSNSASYLGVVAIVICLCVSLWSYWRIYTLASRHQNSVRDIARVTARLHGREISNSTRREKKAANAMLGVFLLFLFCYCPLMCCLIAFQVTGFTTSVKVALNVSGTLSFVNSALNPLWYCWRIGEIRREIRKLFSKNTVGDISSAGSTVRAAYVCRSGGLDLNKSEMFTREINSVVPSAILT
ncbi:QRFP-like peptide receptor [Oculina patagonica]